MAQPRFPIGTKLHFGDDVKSGSPTYTEVPEVSIIGLPFGFTFDEEETTTHGSSGDSKVRRFSPTLADRGELPFEVMFDWSDAVHKQLATASFAQVVRAWKIEFPIQDEGNTTPAQIVFDGYIRNFTPPEANAQNYIRMSGAIRVSSDYELDDEAA